jgi:hypothetical protein
MLMHSIDMISMPNCNRWSSLAAWIIVVYGLKVHAVIFVELIWEVKYCLSFCTNFLEISSPSMQGQYPKRYRFSSHCGL